MARATPSRRRPRAGSGRTTVLDRFVTVLASLLSALNDPANMTAQLSVAAILLVAETVLCLLIIRRVPYTEIDWVAYMQEVGGYLEGERDYAQMRGDTGPLVYPAGFVYLFAGLKRLTGGGIQSAQYIFAALYLATQAAVLALYIRSSRLPPWSLALLAASRRLHSIYVLRLFNDCWAMLLAYVATLALQSRRCVASVVLYSLAVSVKMNVLLMAPGVLAVLIKHARVSQILAGAALGVALQLALGAPFLAAYPHSYITRAFEFSRVFTFKWSVNWAFLPEPAFLSRQLAFALLALHLRMLWSLAQQKWLHAEGGVLPALHRLFTRASTPAAPQRKGGRKSSAGSGSGSGSTDAEFQDTVLFLVFSSNFVGIMFARTIHYQFYCWYFHTLPFLLLRSSLPRWLAVVVFAGIEVVYNVYPPRPWASALLLVMHALVMAATVTYTGSCPAAASEGPSSTASPQQGKQAHAAGRAAAGDEQQEGEEEEEEEEKEAPVRRRRTRAAP